MKRGPLVVEEIPDPKVKQMQESVICRILHESGHPMTIEALVVKTAGMAETYARETVSRLQAKSRVFVLGEKVYLFEKEYPL